MRDETIAVHVFPRHFPKIVGLGITVQYIGTVPLYVDALWESCEFIMIVDN